MQLIVDSYSNSKHPYTDTIATLDLHYGQPHQLALQNTVELLDGPSVAGSDIKAFWMCVQFRSLAPTNPI